MLHNTTRRVKARSAPVRLCAPLSALAWLFVIGFRWLAHLLLLRLLPLCFQPFLFHRPWHFATLAGFGHAKRVRHELLEPFHGRFTVLRLAPAFAGGHRQDAGGIDPILQLVEESLPLRIGETRAPSNVPQNLDARGRLVDVLPTRAGRPARAKPELGVGNGESHG